MSNRLQAIILGLLSAVLVLFLAFPESDSELKATGILTDSFVITSAPGNQKYPTLAYNETSNEFLVAWSDEDNVGSGTDIAAQRIAGNGILLGGEIAVSPAPDIQLQPDVVVRAGSPEYLVVWPDYRDMASSDVDIWGQVIGTNGALVGSNIHISDRPGRQRTPAVGYCPSTDSYISIWDEDEDAASAWDFYIFGQQISATTRQPIGEVITVTADYPSPAHQQVNADLICNSQHNECLSIFRDARDPDQGSGTNDDIYGQLLTCTGEVTLNDDFPVTVQFSEAPGGNKQNLPTGAYNSLTDQYLVVWQDARNDGDASTPLDHLDIYGQLLSGRGQRLGTPINVNIPITTADGNQDQPVVAYSTQHNVFLVVWTDYRGEDADIYGQILLPSGFPLGPEIVISDALGYQGEPAVTTNESNGQFLIIWQDNRDQTLNGSDIYGRFLEPQEISSLFLPIISNDEDSLVIPSNAEASARTWLMEQTNTFNTFSTLPGYEADGCTDNVGRYNNMGAITCYSAVLGDALVSFDVCGDFGTTEQRAFLGKYGRGFMYDQAVGAIAWLMAGETEKAQRLLAHVSSYQNTDGSFGFSFNSVGCNPNDADNFYDYSYIRSGTVSWIAYAFVMYHRVTNDPQFLDEAKRAADYLISEQQVDSPGDPRDGLIRGGFGSYLPDSTFVNQNIEWVSTEHNIDAYFLMRDLATATGEAKYALAAEDIRLGLLNKLWDETKGRLDRGIKEDLSRDNVDTLDAASWGAIFLTAIGETEKAQRSLDFVDNTFLEWVDGIWGYKPNAGDIDGVNWDHEYVVWSEGSLGVAVAYLKLGGASNLARAQEIIIEMTKLQEAYDAGGGILYAAYAGLEMGDFARVPSVAGTGWSIMALRAWSDPAANGLFWGNTP